MVTIGSNCKHCRLRFCLTHCQPEVHGCGAAAKTQARADNRATLTAPKGALLRNGAPSFPLPPPRPEGRGEAVTLAWATRGWCHSTAWALAPALAAFSPAFLVSVVKSEGAGAVVVLETSPEHFLVQLGVRARLPL